MGPIKPRSPLAPFKPINPGGPVSPRGPGKPFGPGMPTKEKNRVLLQFFGLEKTYVKVIDQVNGLSN